MGEFILDQELGDIVGKIFYGNSDFETFLKKWTALFKEVSREAHAYLLQKYGSAIAIELSRSPRLLYAVAPAYSTTFGHMSQIFNKSDGIAKIAIAPDVLKKAEEISKCIEKEQLINAVSYPGVFSYDNAYQAVYKNEILVPPIGPMPKADEREIQPGIFITKTCIPGLERLYSQVKDLGLVIYSNEEYSPELITNKNILLHFARSGW